jgi:hypothetical protein
MAWQRYLARPRQLLLGTNGQSHHTITIMQAAIQYASANAL